MSANQAFCRLVARWSIVWHDRPPRIRSSMAGGIVLVVVFVLAATVYAQALPDPELPGELSDARAAYAALGRFATGAAITDRAEPGVADVWFPDSGELDKGRLVAYEERADFTYLVIDLAAERPATGSRGEASLESGYIRRLIHLKPSLFVVEDLQRIQRGTQKLSWCLRTRGPAKLEERRLTIAADSEELLCVNLEPRAVDVSARQPDAAGSAASGSIVQFTTSADAELVRWLNVFHVRQAAAASDPTIQLVGSSAPDTLSLVVDADERHYTLALSSDRVSPGEIAVSKADGSPVLGRRLLPSGVLPSGPAGRQLLERWDSAYRGGGRPGWDVGRPSTDLRQLVETGAIKPCRALELGCGSGTDSVYLASKGFHVTAIDIAPAALSQAADKAQKAGVSVRWLLADVLAPPELEPFDFIYDRGCYHGVRRQNAADYVLTVERFSHPGTRILLLAGNANEPPPHYGPPRVKEEELRADFERLFEFERLEETRFDTADPNGKGALAWCIILRRK